MPTPIYIYYSPPHLQNISLIPTSPDVEASQSAYQVDTGYTCVGVNIMHGRQKLTDEQVSEIYKLLKTGIKQDAIARQFGISGQHVSKLKLAQRRNGCVKQSAGKALDWLLAGKPVRRECWQDNEYLRYSEVLLAFQLWVDDEFEELEAFEISAFDLTISDWILGTYNPMTGKPSWPEVMG